MSEYDIKSEDGLTSGYDSIMSRYMNMISGYDTLIS